MINPFCKCVMLFLILLGIAETSYAQTTSWSVSPSDYEFSMTVTAIINNGGNISTDQNDKVGAFINGVCHGVASPSNYTTSEGYRIVFLQVYSNTIVGETVSFSLYDASEGSVTNAVNTLVFQNDASTGTMASPYILTTNQNP